MPGGADAGCQGMGVPHFVTGKGDDTGKDSRLDTAQVEGPIVWHPKGSSTQIQSILPESLVRFLV